MKKIGVWNYYESLNIKNYLLFNKDAGVGDNLLSPFNNLYLEGLKNNIEFMTLDMINDFETMDGYIFFDFPNLNNEYVKKVLKTKIAKYLVIFESEIIHPNNWDRKKHQLFDKIFTWHDELIDNKKYFKLNLAQEIPNSINKTLKDRFCTLIAGNKKVNHSLELYSARVQAIEWFEKNHPEDFEFYGIGWDKYTHPNKYIRYVLDKSKISTLFKPNFKNYRGKVDSKKEVLQNYKFAICYENARDIPGYITEKIFDCFFAGCIPVYWGASNITEHIPKECFIDKRDFETYEELYGFMKNINEKKQSEYLNNIEKFLNSDKSYEFSSEYFTNTIIRNI